MGLRRNAEHHLAGVGLLRLLAYVHAVVKVVVYRLLERRTKVLHVISVEANDIVDASETAPENEVVIIVLDAGPKVTIEFYDTIPAEMALGTTARADLERQRAEGVQFEDIARGFWNPERSIDGDAIIALALDRTGQDLLTTAGHEAWHHVELALLTPAERAVLKREMARIRAYAARELNTAPDNLLDTPEYELTATAFQRWRREREEGLEAGAGSLHIAIRRIFERVFRMLRDIANGLRGLGYSRFEDIFETARAGGFRDRPFHKQPRTDNATEQIESATDNTGAFYPDDPGTLANLIPTNLPPPPPGGHWLNRTVNRTLSRAMNVADFARTKAQDRVLPWRRHQEAIERETGTELPLNLDFYVAEAIYHGRAGERLADLRDKIIEPLITHLRASGITIDELGNYLYARHAQERDDAMMQMNPEIAKKDDDDPFGSGMSRSEAEEIIAEVEERGLKDQGVEAAEMVDGLIKHSRRTLLRAGLISQKTYDDWGRQYANYVPLRGFEIQDDQAALDWPRSGRGFDIRGPESKMALGRRSKADNPVVYSVLQAQQAILRAEKNRVLRTLLRLITTHPNDAMWEIYKGEPRRRFNSETGLVETYWVPPQFARSGTPLDQNDLFRVKIAGKGTFIRIKHDVLRRALRGLGFARHHRRSLRTQAGARLCRHADVLESRVHCNQPGSRHSDRTYEHLRCERVAEGNVDADPQGLLHGPGFGQVIGQKVKFVLYYAGISNIYANGIAVNPKGSYISANKSANF